MAGKILNLLYIDEHLSETAEIGKRLRQAGYVVREAHAKTVGELQAAAQEAAPDLVLYGAEVVEPGLPAVRAALDDMGQQAAILVMGFGEQCPVRTPWLAQGARDVVLAQDPELLELVAARELEALRLQRRSRETSKLLEETEARCRALLASSPDAIAYVHEGAHVYVNPAYLQLFGYQDTLELEGLPLMNLVVDEERYELRKLLKAFTRGKSDVGQVRATGIRADGTQFSGKIQLQRTSIEGEPCAQVTFLDHSVPAEVAGQLAHMHQRDALTGLYNRRYFKEAIDKSHAEAVRCKRKSALLYLLLHEHGEICATHGLVSGDEVVRTVAGLLERSVGTDVLVARYAESIFTVLMPADNPEVATRLAEQLRSSIEQLVVHADSRIITTTCCIGACMVDEQSADAAEAIAHANAACEEARKTGGNRVQCRGSQAAAEVAEVAERVATQLAQAIADGRVFFQYQPIASLKGGGGERFEACIRVRDENDAIRDPRELFPRADEFGMLTVIDRWAITRAIALLREAATQGRQLTLLVAISGNTLVNQEFGRLLPELIDGVSGLVIGIEVGLAEKYYRQTLDLAQALRQQGTKMALVEFGRSANSDRLIGLLQPDLVRFDTSLIEALGQDREAQGYVDGVADRLRQGGGEAIAGGIISAHQLAGIWQTELALIQGDFVAAPQESMAFDFEQFVA